MAQPLLTPLPSRALTQQRHTLLGARVVVDLGHHLFLS